MRILQISPSQGAHCGIALFAEALAEALRRRGVTVDTVAGAGAGPGTEDVVLLHHHPDLLDTAAVARVRDARGRPLVLFAHAAGFEGALAALDGVLTVARGLLSPGMHAAHAMTHPARVPSRLEDRGALRTRFGLPVGTRVLGTSGFLRFERQFVEVTERILPVALEAGWCIQLVISPWRLPSPGIVDALERLAADAPAHLRVVYRHLEDAELNLRLQACDLLWCWTAAPSSPYGSGVLADQYASGTRIVAADKQQHADVLALPNVVHGPSDLDLFVAKLIDESYDGAPSRHDPAPVSWDRQIGDVVKLLESVI